LAHIKRGKTKRKVYFLSPTGEQKAVRIRQYASNEGIDIGPLIDIRRCKAQELWQTLGSDAEKILAGACVFRKPFRREALPPTTTSLLPVDRFGMVEIPAELRRSVLKLASADDVRTYHSLAADYWLTENEYGERLYHLVHANRMKEAEMLIASKDAAVMHPWTMGLRLCSPSVRHQSTIAARSEGSRQRQACCWVTWRTASWSVQRWRPPPTPPKGWSAI
jgi:hypothetical protein